VALVEMVLVIPLIALIIGLTFFFGWSMTNQQHVKASSRYASWRMVYPRVATSGVELNQKFYQNRANVLEINWDGGNDQTLTDMTTAVSQASQTAGTLAGQMVASQFPRGHGVGLLVEFPPAIQFWQTLGLTGPMRYHYVRDGQQWRRGEVSCQTVVRDQFLTDVDAALGGLPAPADGLGQTFRRLYLAGW
jgi:hypothetical protein